MGAWATQYAITANHYITNKLSPPIQAVSAQWMMDCYKLRGSYRCGEFFEPLLLKNINLVMEGEYRGPITGRPG
jgi:hypothetical protein